MTTLSKLKNELNDIIDEDTLSDLKNKRWAEKSQIDIPSKTTVVKTSDDPTVADTTIVTTKDPETNITAVKKASSDPTEPVTTTITKKEELSIRKQKELNRILNLAGQQIQEDSIDKELEYAGDDGFGNSEGDIVLWNGEYLELSEFVSAGHESGWYASGKDPETGEKHDEIWIPYDEVEVDVGMTNDHRRYDSKMRGMQRAADDRAAGTYQKNVDYDTARQASKTKYMNTGESKLQEEAAKDPVNWGHDGKGFTPSDEKSLNGQLVWLWHNNTPTTARTAENVLPNPEAGALDAINRGDTPAGQTQDPDPTRRADGEGMNTFGEWVRVGEWIPRVPASGGYYTISEFPYNDFVPSEDDIIEPMKLSHLNRKTGYDPNSNQANAPYAVVQESRNINEDLNALDLQDLIKSTIEVDKHKSKLGEDKDVIVLAMNVKQADAAKDLMSFIERGYSDVIDADSIASENIDGDFVVFVEFERKDTFKDVLSEMLQGVEKLSGIETWKFRHHKSNKTLTMEELTEKIPLTPDAYDVFLAHEQSIRDQLRQLKMNARIPF